MSKVFETLENLQKNLQEETGNQTDIKRELSLLNQRLKSLEENGLPGIRKDIERISQRQKSMVSEIVVWVMFWIILAYGTIATVSLLTMKFRLGE